MDLPSQDNHEVHYVPAIAKVGVFVKDKAQGDDLNASFETEYPDKVVLCVVLPGEREWKEELLFLLRGRENLMKH